MDTTKGTAKAAEAADAIMRGAATSGERSKRRGRSEQAPAAQTEAPAKGSSLTAEQRLHAVEAELRVSTRQREELRRRIESLESHQTGSEVDTEEQDELRILRAQVDDLAAQVRELRQPKHGWRFGISFDILSLM